ncbi:hypothetical protein FQN55_004797 [Onygenales sp. PD_40]|nr:hypothetical protein FQN55_004797 [Onygenales sp. PD_40]KAK2796549.1 hypothetical protein FQN51_009330 [Onygenales sp. PD_10]
MAQNEEITAGVYQLKILELDYAHRNGPVARYPVTIKIQGGGDIPPMRVSWIAEEVNGERASEWGNVDVPIDGFTPYTEDHRVVIFNIKVPFPHVGEFKMRFDLRVLTWLEDGTQEWPSVIRREMRNVHVYRVEQPPTQ